MGRARIPLFSFFLLAVLSAKLSVSLPCLWIHLRQVAGTRALSTRRVRGVSALPQGHLEVVRPRDFTRLIITSYSCRAVLDLFKDGVVDRANIIHLSTALTRLGKMKRSLTKEDVASATFAALLSRAELFLSRWEEIVDQPRQVVNLFWAVATLREEAPVMRRMIPSLVEAVRLVSQGLNHIDVSNSLWAVATLHAYVPESRDALRLAELSPVLVKSCIDNALDLTEEDIVNTLWAAGKLQGAAPCVCEVVPACVEILSDVWQVRSTLRVETLARLGWGLALLNLSDTLILQRISDRVTELAPATLRNKNTLSRRDNRCLVDAVCAFAVLGFRDDNMLTAVAEHHPRPLRRLGDWTIAALLWSYEQLSPPGSFAAFMGTLRQEAKRRGIPDARISHCQFGPEEWDSWDKA